MKAWRASQGITPREARTCEEPLRRKNITRLAQLVAQGKPLFEPHAHSSHPKRTHHKGEQ